MEKIGQVKEMSGNFGLNKDKTLWHITSTLERLMFFKTYKDRRAIDKMFD